MEVYHPNQSKVSAGFYLLLSMIQLDHMRKYNKSLFTPRGIACEKEAIALLKKALHCMGSYSSNVFTPTYSSI